MKKNFLWLLAVVVLLLIVNGCGAPGLTNLNPTLTVTTVPDTGLSIKIDNTQYASPKSLRLTPGIHTIEVTSPQEVDKSEYVSGNDTKYTFEKWNDNDTANPRQVNVTNDATYTAQMKVEYKVVFEATAGGTITANDGYYNCGSQITITATANNGYVFDHWEVNGVNFGNSYTLQLTVNEPKHIKAVFNRPPSTPTNVYPPNDATDIPIEVTLSWQCTDPDGDELLYDIYFGTNSSNLSLIEQNHDSTTYHLDFLLNNNTTYYWKIVAKDTKGATSQSEVWSFTTASAMTISKKYQIDINGITGPIYSSPAMGPDGRIYIGSQGGYAVISLPYSSNSISTVEASPVWSSAVVDSQNNKVYLADNRGYLYIYPDYQDGIPISYYSIYAAPVIKDNYIYAVDLSGNVIRVDRSNYSVTVLRSLNEEVRSSPVLVYNMIFVATCDGYIYAIDPSSGNIVWQKQFPDTFFGGFAVDANRNLYIAGEKLWCIDPWSGNTKWSYELSGQAYGSPVISEDGIIYIGDMSGTLHALDSNGHLIWNKSDLGSILSTCVIGDNGIIYVACGTRILALSPDGEIMSYVELENFVESSPLLHFDKLFVADEAGYFYVINALSSSIQDPNNSWPMFQRNWYHTAAR